MGDRIPNPEDYRMKAIAPFLRKLSNGAIALSHINKAKVGNHTLKSKTGME
jgi:hypothetical protein